MRKVKYQKVGDGYEATNEYTYYSKRFNRNITVKKGFYSDGATGARDLDTDAWWVHDVVCRYGRWDDGTKIDNFTASTILGDILWRDKYYLESIYWWFATYFLGGGAARKNGMRRVKGG